MRIELFGTRGTFPLSPRRGSRYGGHTPCAAVVTDSGAVIVVDAGTGLRPLEGAMRRGRLCAVRGLDVLFTHFHLDHVIGLPFFGPLYRKDSVLRFHSDRAAASFRRILARLMDGPFFPAGFESTASKKYFHRIGEDVVRIGGARVSSCPLNHPQGCRAYRIEDGGRSVVFATDTEPDSGSADARLAAFALGADILIYDATFTPAEYAAEKRGWGHSTWAEGVKLAEAAGIGRLVLSHHDPDRSDAAIGRIEAAARRVFPRSVAARDGLILRLEK